MAATGTGTAQLSLTSRLLGLQRSMQFPVEARLNNIWMIAGLR